MTVIKILVADDHPIIYAGIQGLLGPSYQVVGIAASRDLLFRAAEELEPAVIVLETAQPRLGGLQVIQQLRRRGCPAKVVVFTFCADPGDAGRAIRLGASAYLSKSCSTDKLVNALKEVLLGGSLVDSSLSANGVVRSMANSKRGEGEPRLTPRQLEVLRLFAAGYSAKQVGRALSISYRTAENHKAKLKRLLGLSTNAELIRLALQLGLASPHECVDSESEAAKS